MKVNYQIRNSKKFLNYGKIIELLFVVMMVFGYLEVIYIIFKNIL